ncbi:hypothetical protein BE20_14135 [Sorangium cellulosum]|uniref:Uncharacterized protein n=1 Tax=Sorangium cellulosum TaxID=56 RepID=A0A150SGS9_SORCE|nr:hypothetical protein BE18_13825 [Sorangium cellulosum]KYF91644.1 hypothetical protein BE20_14135 [Sorangium cellulosum]
MASSPNPIDIANVKQLAASGSPALAEILEAYLEQPDPAPEAPPREGALTFAAFLQLLSVAQGRSTPEQRREQATDAWRRFLAQVDAAPPPRLELADLLVRIYEEGTDAGRSALCDVAKSAPLVFGAWGGLKRIYKLAEARLDAELFGALAYRFDAELSRGGRREVSRGTLIYMRRRAWRFLRELGRSTPELYPQFAVEVLRHYTPDTAFRDLWVANHIWAHGAGKYDGRSFHGGVPPSDMVKHRAFGEAWRRSPDPLMLLLSTCQADPPARFAIQGLKKDFADALRSAATPAWLARLATRPLASAHDFLIETLLGSPELHQSKLRSLGLHDAALALLGSPSPKARAFAIEYARAHAADLAPERLAALLASEHKETRAFAASALQGRSPRALGFAFLGRLLEHGETEAWAGKALGESFDRAELPEPFLVDMIYGEGAQKRWAAAYLKAKYRPGELGPAFWIRVLDDPRHEDDDRATEIALDALGKHPVAAIGTPWLLGALTQKRIGRAVAAWLEKADALPDLTAEGVERLKGLVFSAETRAVALSVLGNPKIVTARQLTLPWLLALARRADPTLNGFARRYLLAHMKPQDFDAGQDAGGRGDREAGTARLFALALGEKEPEPMRAFAQTYLRCHHPTLGPEQGEAKELDLKPALKRSAFTAERIWPALSDKRDDVRRFAALITRAELRAWGYQTRVYELAHSDAKEVRNIAFDALRKAGDPSADPALTLTLDELDPAQVFALTESLKKSARELGLSLILKHYARLGGPERLGWLMQSADREVRLFAVRMLWEKHRPRHLPPGWQPRPAPGNARGKEKDEAPRPAAEAPEDAGRFADVEALRAFLRYVLSGIPAGRSPEPGDDAGPRRRLSASEAKRHVIEVVRDLAVEDAAFAALVAPVIAEFTGSIAKGEWQACLAALMRLRRAHPGLEIEGLAAPSAGQERA